MVFNEASQPTHDQAKPKLADNSPRGIRQKALGISNLNPTGFGKWLVYVDNEISTPEQFSEKKADIQQQTESKLSFIDNQLNQIFEEFSIDPHNLSWDDYQSIVNVSGRFQRVLFSEFNESRLSKQGLSPQEINAFRLLFQSSADEVWGKIYVRNDTKPFLLDNKNYDVMADMLLALVKNLTAVRMVMRDKATTSDKDTLKDMLSDGQMLDILSQISKDKEPVDKFKRPSEFGSEFVDNEAALQAGAKYSADVLAADAVKEELLIKTLQPYIYPDKKEYVSDEVLSSIAVDQYFDYHLLPSEFKKRLRDFKPEIAALKSILEGGIPDPAAELTDKIKQEIKRLEQISQDKGEKIRELEEALHLAKQQQAEADNGTRDLESVMPELAEISQQAQETKRKKIEADLLKKSLPDQIKPNTVLLSDSLLSNPEQLKQIVGNSDFLNALFSLYNLDAQAQQVIAQNFNAINGLLPLIENPSTAEAMLEAVKTIFQQIKQTIGLDEIAKIEASLTNLDKPIEPVNLSEELENKVQDLLARAAKIN